MRKLQRLYIQVLGTTLLAFCIASAHATPVVPGSIYDFFVNDNSGTADGSIIFDGLPDSFNGIGAGTSITVYESQSSLGGGQYQIDILAATSGADMFPGTNAGISGVGPIDPLNLTGQFDFVSGTINVLDLTGATAQTINAIAISPSPWDGASPGAGYGWVIDSATTSAIGAIQYSLIVQSVPEPATLALFGVGLLGLGFSRRRKRA